MSASLRSIVPTRALRQAATAAALLAVPALASAQPVHKAGAGNGHGASPAAARVSASDLRVVLNNLMQEHIYLAAAATGAALGGRDAEFKAAAGALDANSVGMADAVGLVYGAGARDAFLPLWRKHIGFVVDYTVGVATKDAGKSDRAVGDLVAYTEELGAFLSSANPNLPKPAVADLVKSHVLTLKAVIDAQAAGDAATAYAATRTAAAHMGMVADPLAAAIAKQFPSRFAR